MRASAVSSVVDVEIAQILQLYFRRHSGVRRFCKIHLSGGQKLNSVIPVGKQTLLLTI